MLTSKRLLARVVQPATEPLTLAETKTYLRVDGSTEDTQITEMIKAARMAGEEYLRKSLITQQWKIVFDDYAPECTVLPRGPVQSVGSVYSFERDGSSTLIDPAAYALKAANDTVEFDARIYGFRVEITYTAGYGTASDIPAPIKYAMLAHVSSLYESRGSLEQAMPREAQGLYLPFREVSL